MNQQALSPGTVLLERYPSRGNNMDMTGMKQPHPSLLLIDVLIHYEAALSLPTAPTSPTSDITDMSDIATCSNFMCHMSP